MSRRLPHFSGKVLFEMLKPIYVLHLGQQRWFPFEVLGSDGQAVWPPTRSSNNPRDEDVSREDYAETLNASGFCDVCRSQPFVKTPPEERRFHPQAKEVLGASTVFAGLLLAKTTCFPDHHKC